MLLERQRQIERLFKEIVALPAGEREGELRSRAAEDVELIKEVRALLSFADVRTGPLDQHPLETTSPRSGDEYAFCLRPGQVVGKYTIESTLGAGGMGVVYLAQQDKPRRRVALKVIRPGLASGSMLRRFEYEAEVLGRLQHPGIAQVIEAGAADAGFGPQPYLAMELIEGAHVREYVEREGLNLRRRIALLAAVCDGVEHAHQRGIIHRDLKPGNILVDQTGQPKILDFGVARAIGAGAADARFTVAPTGVQQLIGTLAYMSPEQVSGHQADLDTRSDVYSLGVILFELATGRLPHDFTDRSVPEAARMIRDESPIDPATIAPETRGDLATIILKVLEKDRAQRYQSAADLAAELRRYLSDSPIAARPPSTMYYIRKFARRNRALVAAMALAAIALIAGFAGTLYGMIRAGQQRDEAHQARLAAEEATRFVLDEIIADAGPTTAEKKNLTLADAVRRAARVAPARFASDPVTREKVLTGLASALQDLAEYSESLECCRGALAAAEEAHGADSPKLVRPLLNIAYSFDSLGMHPDANQSRARAIDISSRRLPPTDGDALDARGAALLMSVLFGAAHDAEAEIASLLHEYRAANQIAGYHYNALTEELSKILVKKGRRDEGIAIRRELIEEYRRRLGPGHADALALMFPFVLLLVECGLYDDALEEGQRSLNAMLEVYDASHINILLCRRTLADVYLNLRREREALAQLNECMKYVPIVYKDSPLNIARYEMTMARALCAAGWVDAALPYAERSAAAHAKAFGAGHQIALEANCILGWAIALTPGCEGEGVELMRETIQGRIDLDLPVGVSRTCLADALHRLGRVDEAIVELAGAVKEHVDPKGASSPRARILTQLLAEYCEEAGRPEQAAEWRERATR